MSAVPMDGMIVRWCSIACCAVAYHVIVWRGYLACYGMPRRAMSCSVMTFNICHGYWSSDVLHSLISLPIIIKSQSKKVPIPT